MIERTLHKPDTGSGFDALAQQIQAGLMAAHQSDGGKMALVAVFQVAPRPGEHAAFEIVVDELTLELQRILGQLGVLRDQIQKILLALGQIGQLGKVSG